LTNCSTVCCVYFVFLEYITEGSSLEMKPGMTFTIGVYDQPVIGNNL